MNTTEKNIQAYGVVSNEELIFSSIRLTETRCMLDFLIRMQENNDTPLVWADLKDEGYNYIPVTISYTTQPKEAGDE